MGRTKFKWYDRSAITKMAESDVEVVVDDTPICLEPIFATKGREKWGVYDYDTYQKQFGQPNFARYGQISIQNMNILKQGGKIAGRRLVLPTATLANSVVYAKVTTIAKPVQDGEEPGKNGYTVNVKFLIKSMVNAKSMNDVVSSVQVSETQENEYPLFAVSDVGRGVSIKKFFILPRTDLSVSESAMFYTLGIFDGDEPIESVKFTLADDIVRNDICYELSEMSRRYLEYTECVTFQEGIEAYITAIATALGKTTSEVRSEDFICGTNRKGTPWADFTADFSEATILSETDPVPLANGTYGANGDYPVKNPTIYNQLIKEFFTGEKNSEIFDMKSLRLTACFDACWTDDIKEEVVKLANWREDFMFFRDYGLDITSYDDVVAAHNELTHTKFAADFCQAYDIRDPYSFKQVTVSSIYDVASSIITHFIEKLSLPFAGILNSAYLSSCIEGTLRYKPLVNMNVDEEDKLKELRVNYGAYYNNVLTIQSVYTTQDEFTDLSYVCNVMAVQRVTRKIRDIVIRNRFTILEPTGHGSNIENYTNIINEGIAMYSDDFYSMSYSYEEDFIALDNRIYTGTLNFTFNKWVEAENFDIYINKANAA